MRPSDRRPALASGVRCNRIVQCGRLPTKAFTRWIPTTLCGCHQTNGPLFGKWPVAWIQAPGPRLVATRKNHNYHDLRSIPHSRETIEPRLRHAKVRGQRGVTRLTGCHLSPISRSTHASWDAPGRRERDGRHRASLAASPALAGDSSPSRSPMTSRCIVNPSDTAFPVSGSTAPARRGIGVALPHLEGRDVHYREGHDAEGSWSTTLNIPSWSSPPALRPRPTARTTAGPSWPVASPTARRRARTSRGITFDDTVDGTYKITD